MKRLISILVALSAWGIAIGQPSVRIAHGPYLQQVTDDGFTVVWTTTINAASWVEVAPDDGSHFYAAERPKYYDSHIGKRRIGRLHRVRVEGLAPGTTYRYRIMQQGVLCDEGNKRVVLGEGYGSDILKHKPYTATTLDEKKDQTEFWVVNDIPIFATRGNHENRGSFSPSFLDYFPTSTGEVYYTFRQGPAYFVVLDCGEDKPDSDIRYYGLSTTDAYREQEARWLKGVVESEEYRAAPLHIVVLHMIPGGKSSWHGEQEIRRLFVPILNEASVDIMLCGHYHRYQWIDDGSRGTNFPILVNSNRDKLVVKADRRGIDIDVVNTGGEVIKRHRIDK